jgi:hypothetical protein
MLQVQGASLATPQQARTLHHFIQGRWLQKIFPRHYQRYEGRLEKDKAKGFEWQQRKRTIRSKLLQWLYL